MKVCRSKKSSDQNCYSATYGKFSANNDCWSSASALQKPYTKETSLDKNQHHRRTLSSISPSPLAQQLSHASGVPPLQRIVKSVSTLPLPNNMAAKINTLPSTCCKRSETFFSYNNPAKQQPLNGYTTPRDGFAEQQRLIDELTRENFNLKLRVKVLENELYGNSSSTESEEEHTDDEQASTSDQVFACNVEHEEKFIVHHYNSNQVINGTTATPTNNSSEKHCSTEIPLSPQSAQNRVALLGDERPVDNVFSFNECRLTPENRNDDALSGSVIAFLPPIVDSDDDDEDNEEENGRPLNFTRNHAVLRSGTSLSSLSFDDDDDINSINSEKPWPTSNTYANLMEQYGPWHVNKSISMPAFASSRAQLSSRLCVTTKRNVEKSNSNDEAAPDEVTVVQLDPIIPCNNDRGQQQLDSDDEEQRTTRVSNWLLHSPTKIAAVETSAKPTDSGDYYWFPDYAASQVVSPPPQQNYCCENNNFLFSRKSSSSALPCSPTSATTPWLFESLHELFRQTPPHTMEQLSSAMNYHFSLITRQLQALLTAMTTTDRSEVQPIMEVYSQMQSTSRSMEFCVRDLRTIVDALHQHYKMIEFVQQCQVLNFSSSPLSRNNINNNVLPTTLLTPPGTAQTFMPTNRSSPLFDGDAGRFTRGSHSRKTSGASMQSFVTAVTNFSSSTGASKKSCGGSVKNPVRHGWSDASELVEKMPVEVQNRFECTTPSATNSVVHNIFQQIQLTTQLLRNASKALVANVERNCT